ncbi:MAG TPA: hypothetical protein VI793_02855 [Anaerolineales bacterium]|nr:hypothetical protein [Anaerolineales bacterium]
MSHTRLSALLLCLILMGGPATPALSIAPASNPPEERPGVMIQLRALDYDLPYHVPAPVAALQKAKRPGAQTANVVVNYNPGFAPEAQSAFQHAVDIWAGLISSPVSITVDAYWMDLGSGVLGSAGPTNFIRNFTGAPLASTWYAYALANKLAGTDFRADRYDIVARFNSGFPNWYFGADGQTPPGHYDFVSVVLHELGHGLGFTDSTAVDNPSNPATGSWGANSALNPQIDPFIYDRFVVNGSDQLLISFPNDSAELLGQFTSNNLFFSGTNTVGANGGAMPRLYAPNPWEQGSSIAHLDEDTYPAGNLNALMTPYLASAESVHSPGPITLCLFKDMGWTVDASSLAAVAPALPGDPPLDAVGALTATTVYLPWVTKAPPPPPC